MSRLLSLAKRIPALSETLRYWILRASSVVDEATADVTTLQGEVTVLEADVNALEGDVTILQGEMVTAQVDIDALEVAEPFITQAAWFVDSAAGSDANTGATSGTALATLAELSRRWSGRVLSPAIAAATITLAGSFTTESLSLLATWVRGQRVTIQSVLTLEAAGTITTYTARNAAGNASATVLADISFAGHTQRRIRLTSGANAGARAWVLADLGGNTCRVSCFSATDGAAVVPSNGDTFVVESFPTAVGGVAITPNGGGSTWVRDLAIQTQTPFSSQSVYIAPSGAPGISAGANFLLYAGFDGCLFTGANSITLVEGQNLNCCAIGFGTVFYSGRHILQSCAVYSVIAAWNSVLIMQIGYTCFEGTAASIQLAGQTLLQQGVDIQAFGATGSRWALVTDQSAWVYTGAIRIYGDVDTTVAFEVRAACSLQYITNKPQLLGNNPGVNDIKLGGIDTAWAAIPTISAVNGAMAVVRV